MILGLDASTSVVGFCFLNDDGSFLDIGHIDLKKYKTLYEKLDNVQLFFNEYMKGKSYIFHKNYLKVFIEEPALAFSKSTAWTIGLLQRWNGMVCAMIFLNWGINPTSVNASHARKLCGIKNIKGLKTKDIAFDHVKSLNVIPESNWKYGKTGKIKDSCKDETDAYVVAYGGFLTEK